ncbi:uncharacterized protein [Lepeophtheirus salmonis]|uniref:Serine/threonine-protein phosphatase n=1 Tax=Lepeophtheirus salmonis TaxID=72036 RepID=A0A0K2US47_LEPSM|nr:serine/threonine-protein phosphatase 5-like [Lepeophtheirus salmonis]
MQAFTRLTNEIPSLHLAKTKCKDSFSSVAFYSKVNLKKKLRSKSAKFSSLIDFDHDLGENPKEPYEGPILYDSPLHPDEPSSLLNLNEDNLSEYESFFFNDGLLRRKCVYALLAKMEDVYRRTPVLVDVNLAEDTILNVCGDIHGQYNDLLKILRIKGPPSSTNYYLFNGDIVDKGPKSLECILLLFIYKYVYPNYIFINRGNHESSALNSRHGFQKEISHKYGDLFMFEHFGEIFRWLPLVHLVETRIFIVHGGISPNATVNDIRCIKKPVEPQDNRIVADLLWSDPVLKSGVSTSTRGMGHFFGPDVTRSFLKQNSLLCVVRSHAEIKAGCGSSHDGCYTVFSAPNLDKGIMGGVLEISGGRYLDLSGNVFTQCTKAEVKQILSMKASELYQKYKNEEVEIEEEMEVKMGKGGIGIELHCTENKT